MSFEPNETSPSQPYHYNELPRDGSFRYLILQPGTGDDPLGCSLQTALLSETTFEAISYVWGSSVKDKEITCDDCSISITTNLSNVLRRLRLADSTRTLWADGICINQDDLQEKGHQVAIMGSIYRSAKCVLIYIGSDDGGHGPLVCSLLDDVNRMIDETCKHIDMSWDSFPFPQANDALLSDSRWKSLGTLLSQDWFKRGWVVREAAFGHYDLVIWHNSEFTWESLMRSYIWVVRRAWHVVVDVELPFDQLRCHCQAFEQRNQAFTQLLYGETVQPDLSLLSYLSMATVLELWDARDRIYAFMELSESAERAVNISPNYNMAPLQVYRQFGIELIQRTKDIQILDYVRHDLDWRDHDIPSWVPRWDICRQSISALKAARKTRLSARDRSMREPKVIDPCILFVRGVVADSVLHVSDIFQAGDIDRRTVNELWNTFSPMLNASPYGASASLIAFLDSLSHGAIGGNWKDWFRSRASLMAHVNAKHDLLVSGELAHQRDISTKDDSSMSLFLDFVRSCMFESRLIVTRRGYIGLAPQVTQKDDVCGILFGCRMPCILRQTAREQHYKFLGATCLMGAQPIEHDGQIVFARPLGHDGSKEWVDWDVEEQDIYLE